MKKPRLRSIAVVPALGLALLLGPSGGPAAAEQLDPAVSFEAWYFRAKPAQQQVDVPCTPAPAPCGPVSPGDVAPTPQAPEGAFVVSFAGGTPGDSDSQGDTAWTGYQWDVLDASGGTVDEFVVTLTQHPDNRGDVGAEAPPIQACNIVAPWGGAPAANAWDQRPITDCASAVVPTVAEQEGLLTYTFDLTDFAQTWADGSGFGVVVQPGAPDAEAPLPPFQVTFAGYGNQAEDEAVRDAIKPRVTFRYTAGTDDLATGSLGDDALDTGTFDSGALDTGSFDSGSFSSDSLVSPGIDVFPDDVGSVPDTGTSAGTAAAPTANATPPLQPVSADTGVPAAALLLLPLALVAFFGVGTALGPAGDPLLAREGGVSRVLAGRRAATAHGATISATSDSKG